MEIVRLHESLVPAAADMLSRAFVDNPMHAHIFPDPEERALRSPGYFAALLRYGLRFGEVLATPGPPLGVAVWLPPHEWTITPERARASGLDQLPAIVGEAAAQRFLDTYAAVAPFHYTDVPADHWYAMVGGVAPEAQGRWIGRWLFKVVTDRADGAGQCCYLETGMETNVRLYRAWGFHVIRDVVDPGSGLRLWTLRRDPRAMAMAG